MYAELIVKIKLHGKWLVMVSAFHVHTSNDVDIGPQVSTYLKYRKDTHAHSDTAPGPNLP